MICSDLDPNCLKLIVFPKELFEKVRFRESESMKNYPACKEFSFSLIVMIRNAQRITITFFFLFQLDNQLPDAYFPSVLYPSPTPVYIMKKKGQKPFIEVGLMRRTVPENNVDTFR